jgi:hypothetical protein
VYGTGADNNHQASVTPLKDILQALAALVDKLGVRSRKRKDLAQVGRCNDGGDAGDFEVVGLDHLRCSPSMVMSSYRAFLPSLSIKLWLLLNQISRLNYIKHKF